MKRADFAARFGTDRQPGPNELADEQAYTLVDVMRKHATPFQEILDAYLHGKEPSSGDIETEAILYESWASNRFPRDLAATLKRLKEKDTPGYNSSEDVGRLIAETAFVKMNGALAHSWQFLTPHVKMTNEQIRRSQMRLALSCLPLSVQLDSMLNRNTLFAENTKPGAKEFFNAHTHELSPAALAVSSAANEIDTALVAHYASIRDPNILILPSPGDFEHGIPHRLNIDLLAIDALNHTIAPLQVKNVMKTDTKDSYDEAIVFIDGKIDLANARAVRRPGRSSSRTVPWGGLHALHLLASQKGLFRINNQKGKGFRPNETHRLLSQSQQTAKRLYKPFSALDTTRAAEIVSDRIITTLREDDSRPLDTAV